MGLMTTNLKEGQPRRKEEFFQVSLKVDRCTNNAISTSTESFFRISIHPSASLDRSKGLL